MNDLIITFVGTRDVVRFAIVADLSRMQLNAFNPNSESWASRRILVTVIDASEKKDQLFGQSHPLSSGSLGNKCRVFSGT